MRAIVPPADIALIAAQIEASPGIARLRALRDSFELASPDTVLAILEQADRLAQSVVAPLGEAGDVEGCALVAGRVHTVPQLKTAWDAFVEGGWPSLDLPEAEGGQGLPAMLAFSVQEILDRYCPAFNMLSVPTRSAARLLAAFADERIRAEWMPRFASGEWTATICISEVDAGSDVLRLRTTATPRTDGSWSITGEKQWISFGDHAVTARIGHCLLARTTPDKGLSLFLVPDRTGDDRNGIFVRRIEEKMGLHASPTCALGFENAQGWLIGAEGRGLQQMFVMITNMRLATGAQGLGIAAGAADLALRYAGERKQGGKAAAAVPIIQHADVQRMLLNMIAKVETLRGLIIAAANFVDLSEYDDTPEAREDAAALLQWLLPIVKTTGGEVAFDVASEALQVLGGAGYTQEWPVEAAIRDARVLTVFEGTTGMQALDLVHRRVRKGDQRGLRTFLRLAREERVAPLDETLDVLEGAIGWLMEDGRDEAADAGATALLRLAQIAATGWIAARLSKLDDLRLSTAGTYYLADLVDRARLADAQLRKARAAIDAGQALMAANA